MWASAQYRFSSARVACRLPMPGKWCRWPSVGACSSFAVAKLIHFLIKTFGGGKIMLTIILFCKIQYFQCKFKSHKSIFHGIRAVFLQQIRGVAGVIADCPAVCLLAARPLAGRQGKAKAGRRHGQRIRRSALEAAIKTKEGGIKQFLDNLLIQSELQQHPTLQGKTARIAARNSPFQAAERAVSAASSASHRLEPGRTED